MTYKIEEFVTYSCENCDIQNLVTKPNNKPDTYLFHVSNHWMKKFF